MRRNFAQVLQAGKIDISIEYQRLHKLVYCYINDDGLTLEDEIEENFMSLPYRGICITIQDFDATYGF